MKVKIRKADKKLKAQVWTLFSRYIRLRDCLKTTNTLESGKCISCGKEVPFKGGDAGHFVQGRRNAILFDETGCHFQCRYCNRFLNGNQLPYRRMIIKMYGEGYDEYLENKAKEVKQFERWELEEMKEMYKRKIKELEGK